MRLAVICPSEIAIRRFMPALQKCKDITFAGIGVFSKEERFGTQDVCEEEFRRFLQIEKEKAGVFLSEYGGKLFNSYEEVVSSEDVDAVYIPLPPALHFRWAKRALENGKHVLVEKPATTSLSDTKELISIAREKKLALHENYMFVFHEQLNDINRLVRSGEIGDVRLYRIRFGFPRRSPNDFRFNKALGGGALIDAGGYTLRYATMLLGNTARIQYAQANYIDEFEVDMYGSAALVNSDGMTVQVAFGMDNDYKCELEVWGSLGSIITGRVLTAPVGFVPSAVIRKGNDEQVVNLSADDAFMKSISYFTKCIINCEEREKNYNTILKQSEMIDDYQHLSGLV